MKKSLVIILLSVIGCSAVKAQECFLGKSQKFIMDSLYQINYRLLRGQVRPGKNYSLAFDYDVFQDSAYVKKMRSSKYGIGEQDTIHTTHYSFIFDNDGICLSSAIYYSNLKDYQKIIADLDAHYQNKTKDKVWLDYSGQVEVVLTKHRFTPDFDVDFHKVKK